LTRLAGAIKARWICEQAHQQLKEELGPDHFEGRSWTGLHRHALMTMIAYAFLQSRRLKQAKREKKNPRSTTSADRRPSACCRAQMPPPATLWRSRRVTVLKWLACRFTICMAARWAMSLSMPMIIASSKTWSRTGLVRKSMIGFTSQVAANNVASNLTDN